MGRGSTPRLLAAVVAVLVVLAVLALARGGGDDQPAAGSAAAATTATAAPTAEGTVDDASGTSAGDEDAPATSEAPAAAEAPATSAEAVERASDLPTVALDELPAEALETWALIDEGGP